jgi:uncharacterized protein YbjT (DUF2867 family)
MARIAAILGASGLVGRHCLDALLSSRTFASVVALNRRHLPRQQHPNLTERVLDLWRLAPSDFAGITDLFCATGSTIAKAGSQQEFRRIDYELPLSAARVAFGSGVQRFVLVSSVGADVESRNFYLRTKGELERDLTLLGFKGLYIFRPSLLLGKREELRPLETVAVRFAPALNIVLWGSLKRYRAVSARAVARAMVAAALEAKPGTFLYHYPEIVRMASEIG